MRALYGVMEPEPLYAYIKGSGWIVQQPTVVEMRDGIKVLLEFRKPGPGEFGSWFSSNFPDWCKPEKWARWCQSNPSENLGIPSESDLGDLSKDWVTFTVIV